MMKKSMKRMVLTGAAVTVMVAGLASPAMAEEVRDHRDGSSVGIIVDPVRDPAKGSGGIIVDPVKDPPKNPCALTPSGCQNTPDPVVANPGDNPVVADPVTKDPSGDLGDAPKMQGTVSIHCRPGFILDKDQCVPNDEEEKASTPGAMQDGQVAKETTPTAKGDVSSQQASLNAKEDASSQKSATASDTGVIHGCPYDYSYDEQLGICVPTTQDLGFTSVLTGDKPFPTTVGGVGSWLGDSPAETSIDLGLVSQVGLGYVGDALNDFGGSVGGPVGWVIQGLGDSIGATGDVAGAVSEGVGQVLGSVSNGMGDVIDSVGNAAEGVWDEVSSWF